MRTDIWKSTHTGGRQFIFVRFMLKLLAMATLGTCPLSVQVVHGAELSAAQEEYLKKLDGPTLLRGDYFKAITIAYGDFVQRLTRNESRSKSLSGEEATHLQWLSHIENYDINIEQTGGAIVVYFSPTVRGDAPIILGGGVKYEIDSKTFQISAKTSIK